MKFLVQQRLTEDDDVFEDHLEPMAGIVADSLEDPPRGEVVWLGGCGSIDDRHYYMLFEAPDLATMEAAVVDLPGLHRIQRVMVMDRDGVGSGVLRGLADRYRRRREAVDSSADGSEPVASP